MLERSAGLAGRHGRPPFHFILWGAAMLTVLGIAYWQFGPARQAPAAVGSSTALPPAPVHTAVVESTDYPLVISGLGLVQAGNVVTVRTRVDGQLERVAFNEGQIVKPGELLAQIDQAPFKAALDQAEAKLAQDDANRANAELDLQRTTMLVRNGNATRQLFDQQTSGVAQIKAQILADKAAVEGARVQLGYTTIKAPLGGQVGLRLVDEGNIVHAADQAGIVTIAQLEPIAVVFSATETQLPAIRKAMTSGVPKVRALSTDGSRVLAEGTLKVIDNQVDTATGTIRLKAEFDNADHALWPGLSVTTELVVGMLAGAIVAPEGAVQLGPNGPFAYVVDSAAKAEMRELVVGSSRSGKAVIEKGLAAGEQVITSGQYKVQPNGTVAVLQPRSDPQAPATRPGADK